MFGQGTRLIVKSRTLSTPVLSFLGPLLKEGPGSDQVSVICSVSQFYPDVITLSWDVDGKDMSADKQTSASVRGSDGTYSISSALLISQAAWEAAQAFTCQVEHESLQSPASRSITKSQCQL